MSGDRRTASWDASSCRIFVSVLFVHLVLVGSVWLAHQKAKSVIAKKPLAVRIVEPAMTVASSPLSPAPSEALSKKTPAPAIQKRPPVAKAPPKEKKKMEPLPAKAIPPPSIAKPPPDVHKEELLSQLDKGLTALATLPPQPVQGALKKQAPQGENKSLLPKSLPENSKLSDGYEEELVMRLRLLLRLPEYGAVRVAMVLNRKGQVQKLSVLSTESLKNQEYIEKTLPGIVFPGFVAHFEGEDQHEFVLSLSNEM